MKSLVLLAILIASASAFNAAADTRFLVFTRLNPTIGQVVSLNDMSTVRNSNYDANRPTRFIIHGQLADAESDVNIVLTAALLSSSDVNVIVVDWGAGAQTVNYIAARGRVGAVGTVTAQFIDNLHADGLVGFARLNVIGHSLGGHVVGIVGKRVTRGRINTIIGLNPAGPLFDVNNPQDRLDSGDAEYVEVIHTEMNTFGIGAPIGHANFYANNGTNQPGCTLSSCDHGRSFLLYAESLRSDRLWARQCGSIADVSTNTCTGTGVNVGGEPSNHRFALRGIFRFPTAASSPFGLGPF